MTTEHQASRTLVKSAPELWAECSDAGSLARHIGEFGEIRITRLEPESAVEWEGEHATGTVRIEPSGWGTRVTLTAQTGGDESAEAAAEPAEIEPDPVAEAVAEPNALENPRDTPTTESEEADEKVEETPAQPDTALETDPAPARGRWKRLIGRARAWFAPPLDAAATDRPAEDVTASDAQAEPTVAAAPEPPEPLAPDRVESFDPDAILVTALDSLGQAHHRPFSRA